MLAVIMLLLVACVVLIALGALLPGLFSLSLIGLALFTGTAMLGLAAHHPVRPRTRQ